MYLVDKGQHNVNNTSNDMHAYMASSNKQHIDNMVRDHTSR